MRLLLINWQDRLNPQAGGAEIHLHEIFGRLAAEGHQITMLVSGWPGCAPVESVDGMMVHRTGTRHTFGIAAPRHYRAELAGSGFDLCVEALNKVPVFSPLWAGLPVVLLVHHLFGTTAFREAPLPFAGLTWLLERPLPRVYGDVPVQAISHSTADDLVARGLRRDRITVIHPGVDLGFFTPDPAARAPEPRFLYLGRLKRYKRVDLAVRALPAVLRAAPGARLLIGGRGEHERALRRLVRRLGIAESVRFVGYVSEEEKRALFRSAWANVFPSPKEGWGITNLEAAACGTASVATDAPGLRESVAHGRTGLLVPPGDAEALSAALTSLATDRSLMERLGTGALAFARDFGWDRAAAQTERHLRGTLSSAAHSLRTTTPATR